MKISPLNWLIALCSLVILTGCRLPTPPNAETFASIDRSVPNYEIYRTHGAWVPGSSQPYSDPRNAIFLAGDDQAQTALADKIMQLYNTNEPIRLEDIVWWEYSKPLREIYDQILRIPYDQVRYESIKKAINYMELQGKPYDIYILSFGIPNHLTTGGDGYFLSFNEIGQWKGQLTHLDMVYMQACFGTSLVKDWHAAGARSVIAFDGFHRNFFYPGFFLRWRRHFDVKPAHKKTVSDLGWKLQNNLLYSQIIEQGFEVTVDQYMRMVQPPILSTQPEALDR